MKELDKMLAAKEKSQAIGGFLDWLLNERQYVLAKWGKDDELRGNMLHSVNVNIEDLLASYFEIDLDKCEQEKREILEKLRNENR